jgi:integrase/recombinase XerD
MKLSEAIDKFSDWRVFKVSGLTVVRYDRPLRTFCLCMKNKDVEDVTIDDVMAHIRAMVDLGWKKNGVNIVCLALRKFFEFLNLQGLDVIDEQLIPIPKKEFSMPRICDVTTFRKLMRAIPNDHVPHNQRNAAFISMIWDTGARIGEIISLNVQDIDLKGKRAFIKTEKSRGSRPIREIFWTERTNVLLKRWLKKREHLMSVFKFKDPNALFISISKCLTYDTRGSRMGDRGAQEMLRVASNRAGLKAKVNAHSMRHRMGRHIIENGGTNADVTNILGHSRPESSMVYMHMFGPQLEKRYRKIVGK